MPRPPLPASAAARPSSPRSSCSRRRTPSAPRIIGSPRPRCVPRGARQCPRSRITNVITPSACVGLDLERGGPGRVRVLDGVRRRLLHRDGDVVDLVRPRRPSARSQRRSRRAHRRQRLGVAPARSTASGPTAARRAAASTATSSSAGAPRRLAARDRLAEAAERRARARDQGAQPLEARARALSPRTSTAPSVTSTRVAPAGHVELVLAELRGARDAERRVALHVERRSPLRRAGDQRREVPALTTATPSRLQIEHGVRRASSSGAGASGSDEPVEPLHDAAPANGPSSA